MLRARPSFTTMRDSWRSALGALVLVLFSLLLHPVSSVDRDLHVFEGEGGMSPEMLLQKYPKLLDIMKAKESSVIPVDTIIESYPDLWQQFKGDPAVWRWFKEHLPHYTIERAEPSRSPRPFKALTAGVHFLVQLERRLLETYGGDATLAGQAPDPTGDEIAGLFAEVQRYRWNLKNWKRATQRGAKPSTAWESHKIDPDYPKFFKTHAVPADAKILDFGTEMGLQAIAIANMAGGEAYTVVGTDLGAAEMEVARNYAERSQVSSRTTFLVDDVMSGSKSNLANGTFDVVIDRAVFHSMMPLIVADPRMRAPIMKRFSERVKALMKPGGRSIFIFKGMSADEKGFRQRSDMKTVMNPIVGFQVVRSIIRAGTSIRDLLKDSKTALKGTITGPKIIQYLAKEAARLGNGPDPEMLYIDLSKHPMPHHFTAEEVKQVLGDEMGFEILEMGKSHLYNDKKDVSLMPRAEWAVCSLQKATTDEL